MRDVISLISSIRFRYLIFNMNQNLKQVSRVKYFLLESDRTATSGEAGDKVAPRPVIQPCLEIHCDNGLCDRIRTDGDEVLRIIAHNPYTNVTLKDLTIVQFVVINADGTPVPNLPDGTPIVAIFPSEAICFGDLPPSTSVFPSTVTREAVLRTCKAKKGDYLFDITYEFSVEFILQDKDRFRLPLVPS